MENISSKIKTIRTYIEKKLLLNRILSALSPSFPFDLERYMYLTRIIGYEIEWTGLELDINSNIEEKIKRRNFIRSKLLKNALNLALNEQINSFQTLAILHWEWALQLTQNPGAFSKEEQEYYGFAHFLWKYILFHPDFWPQFVKESNPDREMPLSEENLEKVQNQVWNAILQHHFIKAQSYMVAQDIEGACFHMECLTQWDHSNQGILYREWEDQIDSSPVKEFSVRELSKVKNKAEDLINDYISECLRIAKEYAEAPEDSEIMQSLPAGMSRDFEGTLAKISLAMKLVPDNPRLLFFAIKQRNEWCHELINISQPGKAYQVIQEGSLLAQQFAQKHLKPEDSINPENEAVRLAFHLASQFETDNKLRTFYLEQIAYWGGREENLELEIALQKARQAIEDEYYEAGLRILKESKLSQDYEEEAKHLEFLCFYQMANDKTKKAKELCLELFDNPEKFLESFHNSPNEDTAYLYSYLKEQQRNRKRKTMNIRYMNKKLSPNLGDVDSLYWSAVEDIRKACQLKPSINIEQEEKKLEKEAKEIKYWALINLAEKLVRGKETKYYKSLFELLESAPKNLEISNDTKKISSYFTIFCGHLLPDCL